MLSGVSALLLYDSIRLWFLRGSDCSNMGCRHMMDLGGGGMAGGLKHPIQMYIKSKLGSF